MTVTIAGVAVPVPIAGVAVIISCGFLVNIGEKFEKFFKYSRLVNELGETHNSDAITKIGFFQSLLQLHPFAVFSATAWTDRTHFCSFNSDRQSDNVRVALLRSMNLEVQLTSVVLLQEDCDAQFPKRGVVDLVDNANRDLRFRANENPQAIARLFDLQRV